MKWTKITKAEATVQIPMSTYIGLLQQRFDNVPQDWKNDANTSLWDQFLQLIEDAGVSPENSNPAFVADNYLVNGEFTSKSEWQKDYPNYFAQYDGDWEEFCQNEGVIYNEEHCALRILPK